MDEHKPYLNQRRNEGCAGARTPHAEITACGYPGRYETVAAACAPSAPARPAAAVPPKTRDIAR